MSAQAPPRDESSHELNFVKGGSLVRELRRIGLLHWRTSEAKDRAIIIPLLVWLPLMILSILDGKFMGSKIEVPFLFDLTVQVRFLLALPLLIFAEDLIDVRLRNVVTHFSSTGIVPTSELPRLKTAVAHAKNSLSAISAELALVGLILINAYLSFGTDIGADLGSWRIGLVSPGVARSPVDWWYGLIAAPIFQFFLLRWGWRLIVWSHLLWKVSRLDLKLAGTHPDKRGGLAFINLGQASFSVIIFAVSTVVAAHIGSLIMFRSASLVNFKGLIGTFVVITVVLFLAPLLVFTPHLLRTKRNTHLAYGALALKYTQAFGDKWFEKPEVDTDQLMGTPDIQSLSDLSNSFEVVEKMRIFLFSRNLIIPLTVAAVLPMLPLLGSVFPLTEIFNLIIKILA